MKCRRADLVSPLLDVVATAFVLSAVSQHMHSWGTIYVDEGDAGPWMSEVGSSSASFWLPGWDAAATPCYLVFGFHELLQLADVLLRGQTQCGMSGGWAWATLRFKSTPFQRVSFETGSC